MDKATVKREVKSYYREIRRGNDQLRPVITLSPQYYLGLPV